MARIVIETDERGNVAIESEGEFAELFGMIETARVKFRCHAIHALEAGDKAAKDASD